VHQSFGGISVRSMRGKLTLSTFDGEIRAERCLGTLSAESTRGKVRVMVFQGDLLDVRNVAGDIELLDVNARRLSLATDSGAIRGSAVKGEDVAAESVSGEIALNGLEPRTVAVKAGSGRVDLATQLQNLRGAEIESESGDVTLRVGELTQFDLLVETDSGEVRTLGLDLDLVEQAERTARFQRGKGGPDLRVSTIGGNLTVRPYEGSRLDLMLKDSMR
jgi:DUF4097 and DUF4098 domain-containing protein YvlB